MPHRKPRSAPTPDPFGSASSPVHITPGAVEMLPMAEHRALLALLECLGSPEPAERAAVALQAMEILRQKGLTWAELLSQPKSRSQRRDAVPDDWQELAANLLEQPALTSIDRAFVIKVMGWRSPGIDGWIRLQEIAERVRW